MSLIGCPLSHKALPSIFITWRVRALLGCKYIIICLSHFKVDNGHLVLSLSYPPFYLDSYCLLGLYFLLQVNAIAVNHMSLIESYKIQT